MNTITTTIFGLIGGLALFLFGMNMMSDCLQKAAGEKMRTLIGHLTRTPLLGVIAGALTTAVLQSSSATTVMVIGFISAGIMTLPQGISVILGANIGTTITAQILAFNISDYIYVIIFVGFFLSLLSRNEKVKYIGQTIFAFGVLFLGIETMSSVMKPLANSTFFINLITRVHKIPVLGVLVGTLMTLVVQSSSATVAVLQSLARQPAADGVTSILGLTGAIPILLGDNIGTTITAVLASLTQSRDAKRAAAAHCIFNISGACLFIWFVKPYAKFITWISTKGPEIEVISRQIANAHTVFNVVMVIIWLPLLAVLVKIVMKLLPDRKKAPAGLSDPAFLDRRLLSSPMAAIELVGKEIDRLADEVKDLFNLLSQAVEANEKETIRQVIEAASQEATLHERIMEYLNDLFETGSLTDGLGDRAANMMYVLSDLDRLGGFCSQIAQALLENLERKKQFSSNAQVNLTESIRVLKKMYNRSLRVIRKNEEEDLSKLQKRKEELIELSISMRREHMDRVAAGKCKAALTKPFTQLLTLIDRAGTSCLDLAETAHIPQA